MELQDVIIVGGGPAGLNAAVVLGRCRRKVLLFDIGEQRNKASHGMHNYLTRDDILPTEFLQISHQEIKKYGVQFLHKKVVKAKRVENVFEVKDEEGTIYHSKKLLIATGLFDNVPQIEGFKELYGRSVFHCPYCDGWEVKDKKLGVYARDKDGSELALALKGWSSQVVLYTDGKNKIKESQRALLEANNIPVVKQPIARIEGTDGQLERIVFKNGNEQACDALFFVNGYRQQCNIAETFDCEISKKGVVITNRFQQTQTPGLYMAGDADKDMHFVVIAAAEGAKAGVIINKELQKEINQQHFEEAKVKAEKQVV
jgi:thioredoxin reductase